MEKECLICGKTFTTNRTYQKYCSECTDNSDKKKKRLERAMKISYAKYYQPEINEYECAICKKQYKNANRSYYNKNGYNFCSSKCKEQWVLNNSVCDYCGKSLKDVPVEESRRNQWGIYCSEECITKKKYEVAKKNGTLKTCETCGKEFIRNSGHFCSRACYNLALKNGWENSSADTASKPIKIKKIEHCIVCRKDVIKEYTKEELESACISKTPIYCSDKCRQYVYEQRQIRKGENHEQVKIRNNCRSV